MSMNDSRATRCGCCGASDSESTGVAQHPGESRIRSHSSRVFSAKRAANFAPMCRPRGRLVVVMRYVDAEAVAQLGVELRLHRAHRDVAPVGGGIRTVKVGGTVEQIVFTAVAPRAFGNHPEIRRQQGRDAVDHRDVEDLTLTRLACLQNRAEQADRQQHAAAAIVPDQIQWRQRCFGRADAVQGTGQGEVVDVVAGMSGQRAVLAVSRHAGIHQTRIAFAQRVGADAQPFGHAGPVHVDEGIGVGGQPVHEVPAAGILHVGGKRTLAAADRVVDGQRTVNTGDGIDPDHVCA